MSENLVWVDVREAVYQLINDHEFAGHNLRAMFHLTVDEYGIPSHEPPYAVLWSTTENIGYLDRSDLVTIDVYAPGSLAKNVAEGIHSRLRGEGVDVPGVGFLDLVRARSGPNLQPPQYDHIDVARLVLNVVSRPLP